MVKYLLPENGWNICSSTLEHMNRFQSSASETYHFGKSSVYSFSLLAHHPVVLCDFRPCAGYDSGRLEVPVLGSATGYIDFRGELFACQNQTGFFGQGEVVTVIGNDRTSRCEIDGRQLRQYFLKGALCLPANTLQPGIGISLYIFIKTRRIACPLFR